MSDDFDDLPDVDSLFDESEEKYSLEADEVNVLFIGSKKLFKELQPHVSNSGNFVSEYASSVDDAIDSLLVKIYGIVLIDGETHTDIVTVSRIVRVNHPLARIVVVSKHKPSLFIADIINQGSVDAFLKVPCTFDQVYKILYTQQARHEINKLLTHFVSQPPELSNASYLLLDPSLTADEDEPVRFVGMMIAWNSVPRYSHFFEELLAKDEILFAGYLSGITLLGRELLHQKNH